MGGRYNYSLGMLIPLPLIRGSQLCRAAVPPQSLGRGMGRQPERVAVGGSARPGGLQGGALQPERAAGLWGWMRPGGHALSYLATLGKPLGDWGWRKYTPLDTGPDSLAGK